MSDGLFRMIAIDLSGKTALVTGAGSGIGRETARMLAQAGAFVVVNDVNAELAAQTVQIIKSENGKAETSIFPVDDYDSVVKNVAVIAEKYGSIDILVNNAAVYGMKQLVEMTPDDWEREIAIDFKGVVHCVKAVLPYMIEKKYGRIISMASDGGRVGEFGMSVYSGIKAGVIGFSKAVAREVGKYGITVNCVSPGFTKTEKLAATLSPETETKMVKNYPLRRLGKPEDHAKIIVFLASHLADYITGQTISSSGGYTMI